jgi:selenocysteine-specific elongation factor
MKHVIVGTAGHIDHGKSSLVLALTGTDPDRWEEEKRRGITIDLGFAHLELGAIRFGFVDVPGHERFVRNMLAGATGIDLVLLVVAADESIKPQTREHFDICRLLGVERGLTVLTKADLIEPDSLELVRLEAEEFLKGSFLAGSPIVPVSSKTGAGLDRLKQELVRLGASVVGKNATQHFRLPIDRAFVMKGFGAVVTGTLVAGSVAAGDEVELFPARRRVRVRGLQVHGSSVERATAGQRTAVNLAGVEAGELERGMVLTAAGLFEPTARADVELTQLPSARPLRDGARVHFHQGTAETIAEVRLLGPRQLEPGATAFAQLRLRAPALLLPGDRFILRQFSPVITIGGGRVLANRPPRHKLRDAADLESLNVLAGKNRQKILETLVAGDGRGALAEAELIQRTGWRVEDLRTITEALEKDGRLRKLATSPLMVATPGGLDALARATCVAVHAFHEKEPLLEGISKEALKAQVFARAPDVLFTAVMQSLVEAGELTLAGDIVKRAGRTVTLSREEEEARSLVEQAFAQAGLTVPPVGEVLGTLKVEPKRAHKILQILVKEGILVKVSEELYFHRTALERMADLLRSFKKTKGERISVLSFKELTGVTRKYAIPLLEYLDRQRKTRRVGDERVILL